MEREAQPAANARASRRRAIRWDEPGRGQTSARAAPAPPRAAPPRLPSRPPPAGRDRLAPDPRLKPKACPCSRGDGRSARRHETAPCHESTRQPLLLPNGANERSTWPDLASREGTCTGLSSGHALVCHASLCMRTLLYYITCWSGSCLCVHSLLASMTDANAAALLWSQVHHVCVCAFA